MFSGWLVTIRPLLCDSPYIQKLLPLSIMAAAQYRLVTYHLHTICRPS